MMNIPLLDLKREFAEIHAEVLAGWNSVLTSMRLLKGENLKAFEREIAEYIGVKHAVGVASGTDALTLGLMACGVGPGDEVILQANAFVAALEAIRRVGAVPILIDIKEAYFGPDICRLQDAVTNCTKAIILVHLYGLPSNLEGVLGIAWAKNIALVEDASHAHGAAYSGQKIGSFGRVGCFSCGPVKNLGCCGDGGFVATNNSNIAEHIRTLQAHGQVKKNDHRLYGFNSRLDELQAVVLRAKLKHLDCWNALRIEHAKQYDAAFAPLGIVGIPRFPDAACVYHQYVIRTPERDKLAVFLKGRGIATGIHYPVPLHKQPAWKAAYGDNLSFPVAEKVASEILSLPVFPTMTDEEVGYVIDGVKAYFEWS